MEEEPTRSTQNEGIPPPSSSSCSEEQDVERRLEACPLGSPTFKRDFKSSQTSGPSKQAEGETLPKKASLCHVEEPSKRVGKAQPPKKVSHVTSERIQNLLEKLFELLPPDVCNNFPQEEGISKQIVCLLQFSETLTHHAHNGIPMEEKQTISNAEQALGCVEAVLECTWEQLNTGHWRDVPLIHRHVYTIASLLKILSVLQSHAGGEETLLRLALKAADMGLLLGAPLPPPNDCLDLTVAANLLSTTLAEVSVRAKSDVSQLSADLVTLPSDRPITTGLIGDPVLVLIRPSIEKFRCEHFTMRHPLKIKDSMTHWPAMSRWTSLEYIQEVAGARTVPVELGSHYANNDYSQKLMTIADFIDQHINQGSRVGYLAQHQLFEQVPELKADIREPEYCCLADDTLELDEADVEGTDINAWFGPKDTLSPLHYDPKHNLLAQVVGRKRILLFPPEASESLYPYGDRLLHNTARVDPERPDYKRFPLFRDVPRPLECILEPGEMLYIPPRWWHHVRSLSTSFSVSFWWK